MSCRTEQFLPITPPFMSFSRAGAMRSGVCYYDAPAPTSARESGLRTEFPTPVGSQVPNVLADPLSPCGVDTHAHGVDVSSTQMTSAGEPRVDSKAHRSSRHGGRTRRVPVDDMEAPSGTERGTARRGAHVERIRRPLPGCAAIEIIKIGVCRRAPWRCVFSE